MKKVYVTEEQLKKYMSSLLNKKNMYSFLNEEGEGAVGGGTSTFSVAANTSRGDIGYDSPKAMDINKTDPTLTKDGRSPKNDLKSLYKK